MNKREIQKRITYKDSDRMIKLKDFIWNEKERELHVKPKGVSINLPSMKGIHIGVTSDCDVTVSNNCSITAEGNNYFATGDNCSFIAGSNSDFNTGRNCSFNTKDNCYFRTGDDCSFVTLNNCTFNTKSRCSFFTTSNCTFNTENYCNFRTTNNCDIDSKNAGLFALGKNTSIVVGKHSKLSNVPISKQCVTIQEQRNYGESHAMCGSVVRRYEKNPHMSDEALYYEYMSKVEEVKDNSTEEENKFSLKEVPTSQPVKKETNKPSLSKGKKEDEKELDKTNPKHKENSNSTEDKKKTK